MQAENLFHTLPLSLIYIFTICFVLTALFFGGWLGRHYRRKHGEQRESSIGSAVGATLGLLAFLLAFTFNTTASRFADRKALMLGEVNAINNAYLRADFLTPEQTLRARALLAEYADFRDYDPRERKIDAEALAQVEELHRQLWSIVDAHVEQGYNAGYLRQFVDPLIEVIRHHYSRVVVALEYRIPSPIWMSMYFMTGLAMMVIGYQFGISRGGSPQIAVALALTFATVILLIADLDRSTEGVLLVDQRPLRELNLRLQREQQRRLEGAAPGSTSRAPGLQSPRQVRESP
ncbi:MULTISPECIES: hypothetical protein [Microbulbifer]|uniref:bestrophin-like domain n=1 Tax=Microbulbifer TaxID=48073 RepID=UPI0007482BC3|nr:MULTISPECIES: hypothetical protein [Microbulbifer]KUJ83842.1 hypothetical protein AVO43_08455 [Microbulbifer sp. ZGT114]